MNCNDLMLGDLVQGHLPNTLSKVVGIPNEYRLAVITPGGAYMELSIDDFLPIPITPEILEKNGFKQTVQDECSYIIGECVWFDKGKRNFTTVTITFYKGLRSGVNFLTKMETDCSHDSGINMLHSCDIEYVHQLQHALRLIGIDKEIVL